MVSILPSKAKSSSFWGLNSLISKIWTSASIDFIWTSWKIQATLSACSIVSQGVYSISKGFSWKFEIHFLSIFHRKMDQRFSFNVWNLNDYLKNHWKISFSRGSHLKKYDTNTILINFCPFLTPIMPLAPPFPASYLFRQSWLEKIFRQYWAGGPEIWTHLPLQ